MGDCMPGLFYIEGNHTAKDIKTKFTHRLEDAKVKQNNWFTQICMIADASWVASGGNPRSVSDVQRMAAKLMGFEDKPWLKDYIMGQMHRCEACGGLRDPRYPICPNCKVIDLTHPKAKELKFAQ